MTKDKATVVDEYITESLRAGHLLSVTEINESENLSYGEGPVYTHFDNVEGLRIAALAEAFAWTQDDQDAVLDEYDVDPATVRDLRRR